MTRKLPEATPPQPPTVDLLLLQQTTYAHVDYPADATLAAVPRVWADWMIDLGVAQPVTPDDPT